MVHGSLKTNYHLLIFRIYKGKGGYIILNDYWAICLIWVIEYIAWGISEVLGKLLQLHLKKIHSSKSQNQVYPKKQKEIVYYVCSKVYKTMK